MFLKDPAMTYNRNIIIAIVKRRSPIKDDLCKSVIYKQIKNDILYKIFRSI